MVRGFKDEDRKHDDEGDVCSFELVRAIRLSPTGLSLLMQFSGGRVNDLWVPLSVIHDDSEVFELGHCGKLVLKAWWARKQGIVE